MRASLPVLRPLLVNSHPLLPLRLSARYSVHPSISFIPLRLLSNPSFSSVQASEEPISSSGPSAGQTRPDSDWAAMGYGPAQAIYQNSRMEKSLIVYKTIFGGTMVLIGAGVGIYIVFVSLERNKETNAIQLKPASRASFFFSFLPTAFIYFAGCATFFLSVRNSLRMVKAISFHYPLSSHPWSPSLPLNFYSNSPPPPSTLVKISSPWYPLVPISFSHFSSMSLISPLSPKREPYHPERWGEDRYDARNLNKRGWISIGELKVVRGRLREVQSPRMLELAEDRGAKWIMPREVFEKAVCENFKRSEGTKKEK